jgi:type II secretory pathway component PulF
LPPYRFLKGLTPATIHATTVAAALAVAIYAVVPPFVPVLARLGPDIPLSSRFLIAAYPFAIALPVVTVASGLWLGAKPGARLLVPLAYVVAGGIVCFLALALYVPLFELS